MHYLLAHSDHYNAVSQGLPTRRAPDHKRISVSIISKVTRPGFAPSTALFGRTVERVSLFRRVNRKNAHAMPVVTQQQRSGKKYFSELFTIKDPLVPSLDHLAADARAYEGLLAQPLLPYFRSELPFKAKFVWTLITSKHGDEQTHYRHSPPITINGGISPQRALTTFVGMLLREYKTSLESVEGSGWTVSQISKIEMYTVPAARVYSVGAAGTWIPTPKELADKHCSINVKSPYERDARCFQRAVVAWKKLQENPNLDHPDLIKRYITNIPGNGKYPADWAPIHETMGSTSLATGGNVSANTPPTTYNDTRYAWTTVTPGVQYCFLWTYTRYLTGANAPGVVSITWGTLANGIVTPIPDYRNGVSFQSRGGVLPSGFRGSAAATPESNWLLQSMRLTYGSWSSSEVNFFVAPTILSLQDAFVTQWQPPPPGWLASGIDGSIPAANARILLTGEATASQNGVWQVNSAQTALARPPDYLTGANAAANFVFVDGPGLTNNDQGYLCTSIPGQDVIDTNNTTWAQYTSEGGAVGSLQMGTDSITAASGALSFVNNNLTTTGTLTSTGAVHGSLAIQAGNIYDSSGQINFSTDNLVTQGAIKAATLTVGAGSIVDSTGAISLGAANLATAGAMTAPHFLTVSDERLKTVTADLEITPDIYAALRPARFNWKASGQADVGLTAQELQVAAPQVVKGLKLS